MTASGGLPGAAVRFTAWLVTWLWALLIAGVLVWLICLLVGMTRWAEIRTDTGDLRFCFLGIPYDDVHQHGPGRVVRKGAARLDPVIEPEWLKCGTIADDVYWLPYRTFSEATAWSSVDPRITRFVMDDTIRWIRRTQGRWSLPPVPSSAVRRASDGTYALEPDWRSDGLVRAYLDSKGYEPPPEGPDPVHQEGSQ